VQVAPRRNPRTDSGFTLIDIMITILFIGIVLAVAIPAFQGIATEMRLGQGAREVERELQTARLKAVTTNRPLRVRFNCPEAGEYRMVELLGSPSAPDGEDSSPSRCIESETYPFPAKDRNPLTLPNHDGPARRLPAGISFTPADPFALEFWPDGSVHKETLAGGNPWDVVSSTGTTVEVTRGEGSAKAVKAITVNGIGKIQLP
jgi:type II secretory pathway pseudopilin PulG